MFMRSKTNYAVKAFTALVNGTMIKSFAALLTVDTVRSLAAHSAKFCENILIGDLRTYRLDYDDDLDDILEEQKGGLITKKFGLYGRLAIAVPGCDKSYQVLDECDKQPKGRLLYRGFNMVSGGHFLFAKSGEQKEVLTHRKLLDSFMKPHLYTEVVRRKTQEKLKKYKEFIESKESKESKESERGVMLKAKDTREIVLNALAEVLLGLTEPLSVKELEILQKNSIESTLRSCMFPTVVQFFSLYKKRKEYDVFAKRFLAGRVSAIEHELKTHPNPAESNLLVATLIEEIKEKYPRLTSAEFAILLKTMPSTTIQWHLNKSSYIKGLFLILAAAENLTDIVYDKALSCGLAALTTPGLDPDSWIGEFGPEMKHYLSRSDIREGYLDSLNNKRSVMFLNRYTSRQLSFFISDNKSVSIPPDTNIIFINPSRWDFDKPLGKYPYTPFSKGRRMCPAGRGVAEEIYNVLQDTMVDFCVESNPDKINFEGRTRVTF